MATQGEGAVTTQPKSKKREIEEFVRDLDPIQVQGEGGKWRAVSTARLCSY